ncbi:MAG: methylmalonyl Co-A mutase-associated GTPase MeaB [Bacteroidales bacterium]|nr:methylmalonyl Co-A mutase-associated GTPase MeaB [Bacteroidales bacterium]
MNNERKKNGKESSLNVSSGVEQPSSINKEAAKRFKKKRRVECSLDQYVQGILEGDRTILAQAITLVESSLGEHTEMAQQIIERCLPYSGNSIRIGITGVPGVGKSTFIETLGTKITDAGEKLAVLAVDPTSGRTGGSIMGDKTRMEKLASRENAFIRPSPSGDSLGGVARKTRETLVLCEAAGFNIIFIETVGVGQSETSVHSMVDFFLLLMLAGAGDELQGIKRGIMEMADTIAITKADGNNIHKTEMAQKEYQKALHLFPAPESGWETRVLTCSAKFNQGIDEVWETILEFINYTTNNGYFTKTRRKQAKYWMYETIDQILRDNFYQTDCIRDQLQKYENKVLAGKMTSFMAAKDLLNQYYKK